MVVQLPGAAGPLLPGLSSHLARQRAAVEGILARSPAPSGEDLHDLRVALRRTAAVARLTRGYPLYGGESLRRAARNLRRTLSDRRTAEVSIELLRERFGQGEGRKTALLVARALGRAAPPAEHHGEGEAARRLDTLSRAYDRRERALTSIDPPGAHSGQGGDSPDAALLRRVLRRLDRARRELVSTGPPERAGLHPFRIRARDLRYGFELLAEAWPGASPAVKTLRELQEAAGEAHDLAELAAALRALSSSGSRSRAAAEAGLLLPAVASAESRSFQAARRVARRALSSLGTLRLPVPAAGRVS